MGQGGPGGEQAGDHAPQAEPEAAPRRPSLSLEKEERAEICS